MREKKKKSLGRGSFHLYFFFSFKLWALFNYKLKKNLSLVTYVVSMYLAPAEMNMKNVTAHRWNTHCVDCEHCQQILLC